MVSQLWKRANGWHRWMQRLKSYLLPHSLARASKALRVLSENESKGRGLQADLSSATRAAESSPGSSDPERHPEPAESSLVQCKADFHFKLC